MNDIIIEEEFNKEIDEKWKKVKSKKRFEGNKELIINPISNSIPFRTPKKIKSLYPNSNIPDIYPAYHLFKKDKREYQLKTFSSHRFVFMGDIFFSEGNKSAFLILININTRYVYAEQLGMTRIEKYIDVDSQTERIKLKYSTTNRKTIDVLIKAFENILNKTPIKGLKFDGEPAIRSSQFQEYLEQRNIKLYNNETHVGTSLSIIDRFCRTIRDMSFTSKTQLLSQEDMDKLINLYNKCRHETLTNILYKGEYKIQYRNPYKLSPL